MVSLGWGVFGPVYLHKQPFLYWKHLQYSIIINTIIIIAIIGVHMVENSLTSVDDWKVGGNDLILFKVLFVLNTDMFHFRYFVSYAIKVVISKAGSV